MRKRTRSILEELNNLGTKSNSEEFIQTTGANLIESSINLLQKIYETYDESTALDLERRFVNSIRTANSKKFKVGVDKIKESKKNDDS
jgi:hypothetical protein